MRSGFEFHRQNGSHRIYTKADCIRPLVTPIHPKDLDSHIIKNNLRSAGISSEKYFELLEDC